MIRACKQTLSSVCYQLCLQDGAVTTEKNKGLSEPQGPVESGERQIPDLRRIIQ